MFAPALKYLQRFVKDQGYGRPIAYWEFYYRRDAAPMLDHHAAVIDHVEAFSRGGAHDESNFVTACNKCNASKNNRNVEDHLNRRPSRPVKGKYGEPTHWDGFASLFIVLSKSYDLSVHERRWCRAIEEYLATTERPPAVGSHS